MWHTTDTLKRIKCPAPKRSRHFPRTIETNQPNYQQIVQKIVNGINYIYNKNTEKQFRVKKILFYTRASYCTLQPQPNDCPELLADKLFYEPGAISLFFTRDTSPANPFNHPATGVSLSHSYRSEDINGSYDKIYSDSSPVYFDIIIDTMSHELAHIYKVGSSEYYNYINKFDYTETPPIVNTEFIPVEYDYDIMKGFVYPYNDALFGPLSVAIINKNVDRSILDLGTASSFPSVIKIKVQNERGDPLENATVKVFCISNTRQIIETMPRFEGMTDNQGNLLLQSATYDRYGNPTSILNKNIFDNHCEINLIKIYKTNMTPIATYETSLGLQEKKIIQNINEYQINTIMKQQ